MTHLILGGTIMVRWVGEDGNVGAAETRVKPGEWDRYLIPSGAVAFDLFVSETIVVPDDTTETT